MTPEELTEIGYVLVTASEQDADTNWKGICAKLLDHIRQLECVATMNNVESPSRQVETLVSPQPHCECQKCNPDLYGMKMFICPRCGNKRCPHATDHELACTNSNEIGQKGSEYEFQGRLSG